MPTTKPDWIDSPWLKSQIRTHLINLWSWVRKGYRFTEEELEELRGIVEVGSGSGE